MISAGLELIISVIINFTMSFAQSYQYVLTILIWNTASIISISEQMILSNLPLTNPTIIASIISAVAGFIWHAINLTRKKYPVSFGFLGLVFGGFYGIITCIVIAIIYSSIG